MSLIRRPMGEEDEELEDLFESGGKPKKPKKGGGFRLFGRKKEPAATPAAETAAIDEEESPPLRAGIAPPLDLSQLQEQLLPPEMATPPAPEIQEPRPKKGRTPKPPKEPKPKKERTPKPPKPKKEKPPKSPKPVKRPGGLSSLQLIILSALLLLVVGMIALLVSTTVKIFTAPAPTFVPGGPIIINTPMGTPVEWEGGSPVPVGETPAGTQAVEGPSATPASVEPTATPVVLPSVSTRFDLQVLRSPTNVDLRLQRGDEYLRLRAYPLALADFEEARTLAPDRAEVYLGLGKSYFHLRRWDEAEKSLGSAISFNADLPEPHFWLGCLYFYEGRYDLAIRELDQAAELTPYAEAEAWLALAYLHQTPPNLEEADGAVKRALAQDEKLPMAYLARAWLRVAQQDLDGAQADFLYAQGLAPYDFEVLNALARFYADYRPERLVEAERLAQQAQNWAQGDLQQAIALHTLGRVYLAQNRKEDAKQVLSQAADLATADGKIALPELAKDVERAFAP